MIATEQLNKLREVIPEGYLHIGVDFWSFVGNKVSVDYCISFGDGTIKRFKSTKDLEQFVDDLVTTLKKDKPLCRFTTS